MKSWCATLRPASHVSNHAGRRRRFGKGTGRCRRARRTRGRGTGDTAVQSQLIAHRVNGVLVTIQIERAAGEDETFVTVIYDGRA